MPGLSSVIGFKALALSILAVTAHSSPSPLNKKQQCPNHPAGRLETASLPALCPLPGHIGILPDEPANVVSWDFPPKCLSPPPLTKEEKEALAKKEAEELKTKGGPEYLPSKDTSPRIDCLFTSTNFRNGHGISLIAKSTIASNLLSLGSMQDGPLFSVYAQNRELKGKPYKIAPVEGKGLGVVATRKIKRGEIIMTDYPALLIGTGFLANTKPHIGRRMLKQAIKQLPEGTRRKVEGLQRGQERFEVEAILGPNSNTVSIGEEPGERVHVGLFAEAARINHGCRPNAHSRFSERRLTLEIMSHVAIEPGEEIVMSYVPITTPRDERRAYLKSHWHFTCTCPLCQGTPETIDESELFRRRQKDLKETIEDARKNGFYQDAINMSRDWLQFAEWDSVPPLEAEFHDSLADLYFRNEDQRNATRYARMAYDGWVRFGSVDDEKLEAAREFLDRVERVNEEVRERTGSV
ncbi:hypothetical protein QBC35DRAFT_441840 [Podospora australis]|uniref:SET domain-containing protein n=1 Tax=Podospora australis TaxID=1536484 RepID=A0AAN6WMW8_9PEZI|nr:hypothetical protein QBC35DRAFT_441840 [Podospora australis]